VQWLLGRAGAGNLHPNGICFLRSDKHVIVKLSIPEIDLRLVSRSMLKFAFVRGCENLVVKILETLALSLVTSS
jgi:hypothetical protein